MDFDWLANNFQWQDDTSMNLNVDAIIEIELTDHNDHRKVSHRHVQLYRIRHIFYSQNIPKDKFSPPAKWLHF